MMLEYIGSLWANEYDIAKREDIQDIRIHIYQHSSIYLHLGTITQAEVPYAPT
jgi:hypothetical protein